MLLMDVNILVYAINREATDHQRYRKWLEELIDGNEAFGMSELVLSAVLRIITNPRAFPKPISINSALRFTERIRNRPNCLIVQPGSRHWDIFVDLCRKVKATGNIVPDAYLAALAIESSCELITADRGFGKFPGLRWRHPLD